MSATAVFAINFFVGENLRVPFDCDPLRCAALSQGCAASCGSVLLSSLHLLGQIPMLGLRKRILHRPITDPSGAVAGSAAACVGFKQMRSFRHLRIDPLLQSHGRRAILAQRTVLARQASKTRGTPSTRRNSDPCARAVISGIAVARSPLSCIAVDHHALVNLDCQPAARLACPAPSSPRQTAFPISARSAFKRANPAPIETHPPSCFLFLFQTLLLRSQRAHIVRVNPLKASASAHSLP